MSWLPVRVCERTCHTLHVLVCISFAHTHTRTLSRLGREWSCKGYRKGKAKRSEAKFWLTLCAGTCHWLSGLWFVACHTEQTRYARWLSWLSIIIHKYANRLRAECAINSLKATRAWRAEDFWADWPQRERERDMFNTQSVWQLPVRDVGRGKGSGKHMPHYLRNKLNRFALESNCAGSSSITKSSRSRSRSRSHTCHRCSLGADVRGVASGGRCPSIYIFNCVCNL